MQPVTPVDIVGGLGVLGLFSGIIMSGAAESSSLCLLLSPNLAAPRLCSLNYEKDYNESRRQKKDRSPPSDFLALAYSQASFQRSSGRPADIPELLRDKRTIGVRKLVLKSR
jgi:hypothetical protein